MAEQLHEGVDADVRTGEFGGVGVAQSVNERAGDGWGVGAGASERPRDARLQRTLCDALAVAADEERGTRRPARVSGPHRNSALFGAGEADGAAVEIGLDDCEEFGFDGDAAFFSAFAFDMDDAGTVVGGADVADVGFAEFCRSKTC